MVVWSTKNEGNSPTIPSGLMMVFSKVVYYFKKTFDFFFYFTIGDKSFFENLVNYILTISNFTLVNARSWMTSTSHPTTFQTSCLWIFMPFRLNVTPSILSTIEGCWSSKQPTIIMKSSTCLRECLLLTSSILKTIDTLVDSMISCSNCSHT